MSRESIATFALILLPLVFAALTALVAVATRAINRYTKDRRVALATELLALHIAAAVADVSQHVVSDLKDPATAGTWDEIAKRTAKDRVVARIKTGFPHLVALVTESLKHPEQIETVLGDLVEKGVVEQKTPAKRPAEIVTNVGADVGPRVTVAPTPPPVAVVAEKAGAVAVSETRGAFDASARQTIAPDVVAVAQRITRDAEGSR